MLSKSELWESLESLANEEGVSLFDMDLPQGDRGVLRVSICAATGATEEGISVDDCARVSRRITALNRAEGLFGEDITLEVSSPGINRRLRLSQHFLGAIGEHIKVKATDSSNARRTYAGTLQGFDGKMLEVKMDDGAELLHIPLADVVDAHVDFVFG